MAAAATDLLQEVAIATATTLDAPGYTIGDTSVTVASTANMPTATGITFAIDVIDGAGVQVAGSYNEYVGTVATATSITNVSHQNGTNRNYSAGSTTRVYLPVSAERENRIVEWGTNEHNQDGTHGAVTATSVATDTITEDTATAGVTIDGLLIKDSKLATNDSVVTTNITNDAVTPAKSALFDYQTDNSNSIASVNNADIKVQVGWGQILGTNAGTLTGAVTFPEAYTTVLGVAVSFVGTKNTTAASSVTDTNGSFAAGTTMFTADSYPITTTGFTANLARSTGSFGNTTYYCFSWIAWGII